MSFFHGALWTSSLALNSPTLLPASCLLCTHRLQLLNLLLQDCTVVEEVTVVLLALTETLAGVTELNGKGVLLFEQLGELRQKRG